MSHCAQIRCRFLAAAFVVSSLPSNVVADMFVPADVIICPASSDIIDPEFEPGGSRMAFTTSTGELRVTTMPSNGKLGSIGCAGTLIDTGLTTQMGTAPYLNGPEWGRSQTGSEIVYMKAMPDGSTSMWRAWQNGGGWDKAMMTKGESRGYPIASTDVTDPQHRFWYLRRLKSGQYVPMWRENELPCFACRRATYRLSAPARVPASCRERRTAFDRSLPDRSCRCRWNPSWN